MRRAQPSEFKLLPKAGEPNANRTVTLGVRVHTFASAGRPAEIEVYSGAAHDWCPPDSGVYNEPQAERAWSRLLALYEKALA